jgi:hypothetical protein
MSPLEKVLEFVQLVASLDLWRYLDLSKLDLRSDDQRAQDHVEGRS